MLHVGQILYDNDPRYEGRKVEIVRVEDGRVICKCGPPRSQHPLVTAFTWTANGVNPGTQPRRRSEGEQRLMVLSPGDYGWLPMDTAPSHEDVALLVVDVHGAVYRLGFPCRRTAAGWGQANPRPGGHAAETGLRSPRTA